MIVRAFQPEDLRAISLQPAQAWMRSTIQAPGYLEGVMRSNASTALDGRDVLAIGALFAVWPGRFELCALLSSLVGPSQMLALHRCARRLIACARGRIEVTVDGEFEEAHRWMRMLGFTLETPAGMRGYLPNGGTSYLYARVQ